MNTLVNQARAAIKAGDKAAVRETVRAINARTERKREAQKTGRFGL